MDGVVAIASLLVGAFMFLAAPVLLAMRVEAWRLRRALEAFAGALEEARLLEAPDPGAWHLARIEGRHRGCDVTLAPRAIPSRRGSRGRMAMHLVVRVAVPLGEGTLAVRHGALVTTGPLALRCDDRALIAALEALGTVVSVARHEASATVALPRGPRAAAPLVALVEALAAPGAGARPR